MKYKIIKDENINCAWKCPECPNIATVSPDWYEQNGTPCCDDCSEDMVYLHTMIREPT